MNVDFIQGNSPAGIQRRLHHGLCAMSVHETGVHLDGDRYFPIIRGDWEYNNYSEDRRLNRLIRAGRLRLADK